ncbi:hypothetical protein GCM10023201_25410 [Actinomycetospora corticicola]|uniref:Uncharacterized protein n=1 Tax=Actinomycetospora corticicola TaxID=663602 RepID=A0A7Y9DXQ0_9PSEU|nr:hypothetical protein [Actinomycetospora corticicola]NYD37325.1 hypothetical protein [Actinomycetospora corticicola]
MTTTDGAALPLAPVTRQGLLRVGLHVLLAALPLLAISAHVFGLITMNWSAALLVIPLATTILALSIFDPHPEDRVILHGFVWGIIACALYDVFRLDTVYMLGWWADFIPTMGTWIVGDGASKESGAWVGYLWRYLGDGGGIGVTFFVLAAFLGLHRRPAPVVVAASVAFAVFPVWAGLIGTVWLAPRGQTMMFPLTPVTITLSLIGHLIFGLIMGLGFVKTRSAHRYWPWTPVVGWFVVAEGSAEGTLRVARPVPTSGRVPSAARPPAAAAPARPAAPAQERPHVVPPPPMPVGHPSAPIPRQHPSGPLPVAGPSTGSHPTTGSHPRTGSGPIPVAGPSTGSHPSTGSGPIPVAASSRTTSSRTTSSTRSGSSGGPATGSTPRTGSTRTAPSSGMSDTGNHTLDPETWALWQRQLATTVKGRRTHRWR